MTTVVSGVPVGLGEPCFDKLEALKGFGCLATQAELAKAMMSLPATKAFERLGVLSGLGLATAMAVFPWFLRVKCSG